MKIKTIQLQHTNPSLGPHEVITTVTLASNSSTEKEISTFINNAIINEACSLADYLNGIQEENQNIIKKVLENTSKKELNQGAQISNLIFHFETGKTLEISDVYRRYSLTNFYPEFTKYMVANGTITKEDNSMFGEARLKY